MDKEYTLADEFKLYEEMFEDTASFRYKPPYSKEELQHFLEVADAKGKIGLFLGYNTSDSDVMIVGHEPYSDTQYTASYNAKRGCYELSSDLWGADGDGPDEGISEEYATIDELYERICELDPLSDEPDATNFEKYFAY